MKAIYEQIFGEVGITFYALFPMSVVGLGLIIFLICCRFNGDSPAWWVLKILRFIQGCACEIGLLGSVIALSMSFGRLEPNISKEIVSSMLTLLGHAFGSSIYGVLIYLLCSAGLFFMEEEDEGKNEQAEAA